MRAALLIAVLAVLLWLLVRMSQGGSGDVLTGDFAGSGDGLEPDAGANGGVSQMASVRQWAESIARFEGYYKPGSVAQRNNNPGNIKGLVSGATGTDEKGFAIFPSEAAGFAALESDLSAKTRKYSDWSLLDVMRRYLGGSRGVNPPAKEGNAQNYAGFIADNLGVAVNDTLGQIFKG